MKTYTYWYPSNKFFCWHGKKNRAGQQVGPSDYGGLSGTEIYCTKCYLKHSALYFNPRSLDGNISQD